jgi:hypothetical protein
MPRRIHPTEATKPVAFTLTASDITALNALADRDDMNRSMWLRTRIRREAVALDLEEGGCSHLPVIKDENARSWWVRLGKSNPFLRGGHCVNCWGDAPPKKVAQLPHGVGIWVLADGTEVRA